MPSSQDDAYTHEHGHGSELSEIQVRVRALETVLVEKGYVDPQALDAVVETYETKIGPHVGARVVARAWADPEFAGWLFTDTPAALAALDIAARQGENMVALRNTPQLHNMVVCTLCSCYPWAVLGLPPVWYKSAPYRARAVSNPREVLREFGVELAPDVGVRVWDSTSEMRYLVVPLRPAGTEGWEEADLARLVTRDSMIGTGLARQPETAVP